MAWRAVADSYLFRAGDRFRAVIGFYNAPFTVAKEDIRGALAPVASLLVEVARETGLAMIVPGYSMWELSGKMAQSATGGEVSQAINQAVGNLVTVWYVEVKVVERWEGSLSDFIPTVPTETTISLVAVAAIVVIAWLLWKELT